MLCKYIYRGGGGEDRMALPPYNIGSNFFFVKQSSYDLFDGRNEIYDLKNHTKHTKHRYFMLDSFCVKRLEPILTREAKN